MKEEIQRQNLIRDTSGDYVAIGIVDTAIDKILAEDGKSPGFLARVKDAFRHAFGRDPLRLLVGARRYLNGRHIIGRAMLKAPAASQDAFYLALPRSW